jgi:hypothetical protein
MTHRGTPYKQVYLTSGENDLVLIRLPAVPNMRPIVAGWTARAQQTGKVWRIGFLSLLPRATSGSSLYAEFQQGIRDLGYVDGKDFVSEWRSADGKYERLPVLAASRPFARRAERPRAVRAHLVLILLAYVALWTIYGVIAKGGQDIHVDMSEQFTLARELALGYPNHPPLNMLIVRLWFAVFPTADWAYYLLAATNAAIALWIAWRLFARFFDGHKRILGLALLTLVPFFNFHALKFNRNTVLMPLWAATTLFFLRSFETRRLRDAALAGLFAAVAMYGKYWSAVLLLGLAVAAVTDPRRAEYFRSPAPWVTMVVGGLALAPHLIWLVENDFAPFSYAVFVHGGRAWRPPSWGS